MYTGPMDRAALVFATTVLLAWGTPAGLVPSRSAPPPSFPAALTCDGEALPGASKEPLPLRPQIAGVQTADAKNAKRLFDEEHWAEAKPALARVAEGATGDDQGNRQLAAYQEAVTLFRLGDLPGAARIFGEIARERSHLRHGETLLWVAKIATEVPELTRSLAFYTEDDITKYDNPDQRETYWKLAYLMGRERIERKLPNAAKPLFARVDGPLRSYGKRCAEKASAMPPQPL